MRDVPVDDFARLNIDAIGRLHAAGIDVVLMEPQWSPKLVQQPHYANTSRRCARSGTRPAAPVVRRFDIMKSWVASGQFVDANPAAERCAAHERRELRLPRLGCRDQHRRGARQDPARERLTAEGAPAK